jgi:xylulokinase
MGAPRTDPQGYGNVFGNPAGGFMALCCFANGSLAREEIARRFGLDWGAFARAIVDETKPGNDGNLLLPYFVPEITPRLLAPAPRWFGSEAFVAGRDAKAAARAVVEAQALSLRAHSSWIGESFGRVLVTGGAAKNRGILRVLADVLGAEMVPLRVGNSSALGGALRAAQAVEGRPWAELFAAFSAPDVDARVTPDPRARPAYEALGVTFTARLGELLAAPPSA